MRTLVYEQGHSKEQAADWLRLKVSTVMEYAKRLREKHRLAGEPLPDKRRHFVSALN